jgi:hypothetical protein
MSVSTDPNGVQSASEYDVRYVHIYTNVSELPVDVTKMVNFIEVFESIYSPHLTVNVNLTDAMSLNSALPLIGEEYIELDVRGADGITGIIKQGFYIYKMSDRMAVSDKAFTYTLHCVSASAIEDMNLKVSEYITGTPSDLVERKFSKAIDITKPIYSEPSKNTVAYISNYWSPLQNIKYLADRAVSSKNDAASYVFFETKKSFNFVTLDALVSQASSYEFVYSTNTHSSDVANQQSIVQKMYVDEAFNYMDRLKTGAYGNRTLVVDAHSKRYEYAYYDFIESFVKHSRLNTNPFGSTNGLRRINSVFRTRNVANYSFTDMPSENTDQWFRQRLTEIAALSSQSIYIDVAGRFNIYAGNVVNLLVPLSTVGSDSNGPKPMSEVFDRTLSGRYLVTGIKHLLNRERHELSIQLSKDSLINMSGTKK